MVILTWLLQFLGGGVLKSVLATIEHRTDAKTEITKAMIDAELERRRVQADVVKAELSSRIAWFPRFLASMAAALYLCAHIIDAIWQLPGDVAPLDGASAAVVATIFAGMFLTGK